jgi:hypothetical protein
MPFIRFILLVFLGLMVRRIYLSFKGRKRSEFGSNDGDPGESSTERPMKDLTEQDIDDADFEEIP